ncbi:hypothetical protein [Peribacillus muralis]|uniref:hypothetical protein n=1 Tax=Peribacillus muralis TaxID=264697 RepID=UPI003CFFA28C
MKKILSLLSLIALVFVLGACGNDESTNGDEKKEAKPKEEVKKEEPKTEKNEKKVEPTEGKEKKVELTREEKIEKRAKKIIKKNYNKTTVNQLEVNENLGLNDGSYIVLPHLKWDVKNSKKMTKEMIEMYSDDLAANLAKESDISEITVFWEVPYHLKGSNLAKFSYEKSGDGMAIGERWYDPSF